MTTPDATGSGTPRSDEMFVKLGGTCFADFARQLERELREMKVAFSQSLDREAALRAEVDRLRKALERYGRHTSACSFHGQEHCDCGLDAALAGGTGEGGK